MYIYSIYCCDFECVSKFVSGWFVQLLAGGLTLLAIYWDIWLVEPLRRSYNVSTSAPIHAFSAPSVGVSTCFHCSGYDEKHMTHACHQRKGTLFAAPLRQ